MSPLFLTSLDLVILTDAEYLVLFTQNFDSKSASASPSASTSVSTSHSKSASASASSSASASASVASSRPVLEAV